MLTIKFRHLLAYAIQFQYETINSSLRHRFVTNHIQFRLICSKVWLLSPIPGAKNSELRTIFEKNEKYVFHFINGYFVGVFTRIICPNLCLPSKKKEKKTVKNEREGGNETNKCNLNSFNSNYSKD